MAVTIKQIADLAGVSSGTVDRALHNRAGVNAEVAARIKQIAQELDYKPNLLARGLANTGKSYCIGVLINSAGNEFFNDVLKGIKKAESEFANYGVTVHLSILKGYDIQQQLDEIDKLEQAGIDALAITPINDKRIVERLNRLSRTDTLVCTLNSDADGIDKLCFIGCNYQNSGELAGELIGLITQKHAKVGIITGSLKMLGHNLRISGCESVIQQNYPHIQIVEVVENNDDEILSYQVVKNILTSYPQIDALYFCAGGVEGGIKAVTELGLAGKICIVTVDETPIVVEYLKRGVIQATISQQPYEQGYQSICVLFDFLFSNKRPKHKNIYTKNEVKLKYHIYNK